MTAGRRSSFSDALLRRTEHSCGSGQEAGASPQKTETYTVPYCVLRIRTPFREGQRMPSEAIMRREGDCAGLRKQKARGSLIKMSVMCYTPDVGMECRVTLNHVPAHSRRRAPKAGTGMLPYHYIVQAGGRKNSPKRKRPCRGRWPTLLGANQHACRQDET